MNSLWQIKFIMFIYFFSFGVFSIHFTVQYSIQLIIRKNIIEFTVQMIAQQRDTWIQSQNSLMGNKKGSSNSSNSDPSQEENIDVQQLRRQGQLGIYGRKSWLIRALSILWLISSIVIVYLFGNKNEQISNKYFLYVTPPGLFFTIWGVILGFKMIVNIINTIKNIWTVREHVALAINNLLLDIWAIVFDLGTDEGVFAAFFLLVSIIPVLLYFWSSAGKLKPIDEFTFLSRNAYALYLGWVVAAANLNLGIMIVYWWQSSLITELITFWVMTPICALVVTSIIIYREGTFGLRCFFLFWISIIWAFVGAAMTSKRCFVQNCHQS